ncbi:transglycosylase SLT domain-containing protein [Cytobacillus praedii]|uniref:PcsB-like coiled-coil domain-containing protein n=1 Tax=Cytobacillus praedii TaxID=1742358 RepID=UPI002E1F23E3|nr:transglycosylase SLT domain-containing protein [Cytobacillus praedii]
MRKIYLLVLVISLNIFVGNNTLAAESIHTILKERGEIAESQKELTSKLERLNKDLNELSKNETALEKKIRALDTTIKEKETKQLILKNQIFNLAREVERFRLDYNSYNEKIEKRKSLAQERLKIFQENDGVLQYISFLLESDSITNLIERGMVVTKIIELDQSIINQFEVDQKGVEQQKDQLNQKKEELRNLEGEYQQQIDIIKKQKDEKTNLLEQIKVNIAKSLSEQDEYTQQQDSLTQRQNIISNQINSLSYNTNSYSSKEFPFEYLPFYIEAGNKFNVDWHVIAAIHSVESNFSRHKTMISSKGALGHMQFLPLTWIGYKHANGSGNIPENIDITNLDVIATGNGYGKDMNEDGKADPFDLQDSLGSAAWYLSKHGYSGNPAKAIWHYNHAQWYVDKVLNEAKRIKGLVQFK